MNLRRCTARLLKGTDGAGPYFGRCDLPRGHSGLHMLERGMDEIHFATVVVLPGNHPTSTADSSGGDA